mgnify:CR=1 FL=1
MKVGSAVSLACLLVVGCVIAEAPADIPKLPEYRPAIVSGSTNPPLGAVLTTFPAKFVVTVELVDPTVAFSWRAYLDYDFANRQDETLGLMASGISKPDSARSRQRRLELVLAPPTDLKRCHVIEVIVANRFLGELEGRPTHTPEEPGGDSVQWFFNPSGDLSGCPTQSPVATPVKDSGVLPLTDGGPG